MPLIKPSHINGNPTDDTETQDRHLANANFGTFVFAIVVMIAALLFTQSIMASLLIGGITVAIGNRINARTHEAGEFPTRKEARQHYS